MWQWAHESYKSAKTTTVVWVNNIVASAKILDQNPVNNQKYKKEKGLEEAWFFHGLCACTRSYLAGNKG